MSQRQVSHLPPEFIRLPKPGTKCPHTGLTRTVMFKLCQDGLVASKTLRRPGCIRGTRIVSFESLMAYLNNLPSDMGKAAR